VKRNTFEVGGYGENDMGAFTVEGNITLLPPDKLREVDGLKNIKKIKVAKFELRKIYTTKVIEELIQELDYSNDLKPVRFEEEMNFVPDLDEVIRMREEQSKRR
jgi:hypothetical protein